MPNSALAPCHVSLSCSGDEYLQEAAERQGGGQTSYQTNRCSWENDRSFQALLEDINMHGQYVNRKPFSILDEIAELYFSERAELRSVSRQKNLINICSFISKDAVK